MRRYIKKGIKFPGGLVGTSIVTLASRSEYNIIGSLTIIAKVDFNNGDANEQTVLSKYTTFSNKRQYGMLFVSNKLRLFISTNGTDVSYADSNYLPTNFSGWVKGYRRTDNSTVEYSYSTNGVTWVSLGNKSLVNTDLFTTTETLNIGAYKDGSASPRGIYNGVIQ
jgi:hypothetical protein